MGLKNDNGTVLSVNNLRTYFFSRKGIVKAVDELMNPVKTETTPPVARITTAAAIKINNCVFWKSPPLKIVFTSLIIFVEDVWYPARNISIIMPNMTIMKADNFPILTHCLLDYYSN